MHLSFILLDFKVFKTKKYSIIIMESLSFPDFTGQSDNGQSKYTVWLSLNLQAKDVGSCDLRGVCPGEDSTLLSNAAIDSSYKSSSKAFIPFFRTYF